MTSPSPREKYGKLQDCLGFLFAMSHEKTYLEATTRLRPLDIQPRHVRILIVVEESQVALNQQTIAEKVGVHRNVMVTLTDQLEHRGFVKRISNPENRREYFIQITSRGRKVLEKAKVIVNESQETLLKGMSRSERDHLVELLRKFLS